MCVRACFCTEFHCTALLSWCPPSKSYHLLFQLRDSTQHDLYHNLLEFEPVQKHNMAQLTFHHLYFPLKFFRFSILRQGSTCKSCCSRPTQNMTHITTTYLSLNLFKKTTWQTPLFVTYIFRSNSSDSSFDSSFDSSSAPLLVSLSVPLSIPHRFFF